MAVAAACLMLLSGCKSAKSTKGRSHHGYHTAVTEPQLPDYTHERPDNVGQALVAEARSWLGTPYQYGGHSKAGTDCSGMVMEVYLSVCGVKLPRNSQAQLDFCTNMKRRMARPGDLLFFGNTSKGSSGVNHVGMYIGNGQMIHASSSRGVIVSEVDTGYWGERLVGAGRVKSALGKTEPAAEPHLSIDRLDDIINQKVDSIFSSVFMD